VVLSCYSCTKGDHKIVVVASTYSYWACRCTGVCIPNGRGVRVCVGTKLVVRRIEDWKFVLRTRSSYRRSLVARDRYVLRRCGRIRTRSFLKSFNSATIGSYRVIRRHGRCHTNPWFRKQWLVFSLELPTVSRQACLSTTNPAYGYWGVPRDREDVIRNDRKIGRI